MKFFFTIFVLTFISTSITKAQLPDGSIAPDVALVDLDGNTWNLYEILDQGKSVVFDLSTTWCGPCWNYHQSGALENLYEAYGPNGTDEMMVFMVEGDPDTNVDCIYDEPGCNSSTLGDWTEGTNYPIINDDNMASLYAVSAWPTIYHICPNRVLRKLSQSSTADIYALNDDCLQAFGVNNAGLLTYTSLPGSFCNEIEFIASVPMQNLGTSNMTSATLELWINGSMNQTMTWTGELGTFELEEIAFNPVNINEDVVIEIKIVNVNGVADEDISNNSVTAQMNIAASTDDNYLVLELKTDNYPYETYWEIRNENGNTLYRGGNDSYVNGPDNGAGAYTNTNTVYTHPIALPIDGCYEFWILDASGDGICCLQGDGYYKLLDSNGNILMEGGNFTEEYSDPFRLSGGIVIENQAIFTAYIGEAGYICVPIEYSPSLALQNLGGNNITSATIAIADGSGVLLTENWTGNISSGSTDVIQLTPIILTENTNLTITLFSVNGETLLNNSTYEVALSVNSTAETEWQMKLKVDNFGYEIYWQITNSAEEVMAYGGNENVGPDGGGSFANIDSSDPGAYAPNELITQLITLPADVNDCYTFRIVDNYGNGMTEGGGYVEITDLSGATIFNADYTDVEFATLDDDITVTPVIASVPNLTEVSGLKLYPSPADKVVNIHFNLDVAIPLQMGIYNLMGQMVKSVANDNFAAGQQTIEADVHDLANGVYYISLANGNKQMTERFTVMGH